MPVLVEQIHDPPPQERLVEVVERKGIGHPDTICDALAEEVSRALSRHHLDRFGRVLHHNVDKALLCGGAASPRFGGGEVTAPIEIILAGRASTTVGGVAVPVQALAVESCRAWLRAHFHALDPDRNVRIECRFRPGSSELVDLFARGGAMPRANDTSIGVGFAPLSPLEDCVLDVERWLNDDTTKRAHPETGEDVKVMGVRHGGQTQLTVACAFISAHVTSATDYLEKKSRLKDAIQRRASHLPAGVTVNAADDPSARSLYLTVTGTSAEAGDDGQVGRGNRASGLITPGRPMTLEATAGKNPVSHVGKLYNVAAQQIAKDVVASLPGVVAAECVLVSQIGAPIDQPSVVSLRLRQVDGRPVAEHATGAEEIARNTLGRLGALSARLIAAAVELY